MRTVVPLLAGGTDSQVIVVVSRDEHKFGVVFGLKQMKQGGQRQAGVALAGGLVLEPEVALGDAQQRLDLELVVVGHHFGGVEQRWVGKRVLSTRYCWCFSSSLNTSASSSGIAMCSTVITILSFL